MSQDRLTRRSILASGSALSSGFMVLRDAQAQKFAAYPTIPTSQADRLAAADPLQGYPFFASGEAEFVEAAVSRIIPKDDLGPGALECGVAVFIDRQLAGSAAVQSHDATTVLHIILQGSHSLATNDKPTPLAMPAFGWKLSDQQVADVATYIRNSWGNRASQVDVADVKKLRSDLVKGNGN